METHIPDLTTEFVFKTSRSGGKGGQHVNKVSTKVELSFSIAESQLLTEHQRGLLLERLAGRLTKEGLLLITAQSERSQPGNKRKAEKCYALLAAQLVERKNRKPTRLPKAVKEKRLLSKRKQAEIKKLRSEKEF